MTAIISGNNLGLNLSSLASLGQRGQLGVATQGRNGERAYVNAATGNLVVQDLDSRLFGVGSLTETIRTYNSQGQWDRDGNNDGWQGAPHRVITLGDQMGGWSPDQTTLVLEDADGTKSWFDLVDAGALVFQARLSAGSAFDTIQMNSREHTCVWTDGATGRRERYTDDGSSWGCRIESAWDTEGNRVQYTYTEAGQLDRVTHQNGEYVKYTWGGESGNLLGQVSTGVRDEVSGAERVLSQVSYQYDDRGRLWIVDVALNPDGTVPAGSEALTTYRTTYGYDGESSRIASITQSDGTSLAVTYARVGAYDRVETITDGDGRVTRFSYDTENCRTTITDPLGIATVIEYDRSSGLQTLVRTGVTAANQDGLEQVRYTYDASGDVHTITDGTGRVVTREYVGGNLLLEKDGAGNRIERVYDAQNQLLNETTYAPDLSTPLGTIRYVYDVNNLNLLRFVISADGCVTEHRYDARGQRTSTIRYAGGKYPVDVWSTDSGPDEPELRGWVAEQDRKRTERTDYSYDHRGQLKTVTTYETIDGEGVGTGTPQVTHLVYDQRGLLLQTVTPDGRGITSAIYDGLGRVVTTTAKATDDASLDATTITQYDDANNRTTVSYANGLTKTSTYDRAGRLASVSDSSRTEALGTTRYYYDGAGRLLMIQDPTGARTWSFHDDAGRKVADVDSTGRVTEYVFDSSGRVTQAIVYAHAVDPGMLVDPEGNPIAVELRYLRSADPAHDQRTWTLYDAAGRIAWQVDAAGYVTRTEYDAASRVTDVTRYARPIDPSALGNGIGVTLSLDPGATVQVVADERNDRVLSNIYDRDGRLMATVDGEGFLTERRYDSAGRLVETVGYTTRMNGAEWVEYTENENPLTLGDSRHLRAYRIWMARRDHDLSYLVVKATDHSDVHTFSYYDARGLEIARVDGEQYLTEFVHDLNGRLTKTIRYDQLARATQASPLSVTSNVADLRDPSAKDQVTVRTWDGLGRLSTETNAEGTITRYEYDAVGHLVSTTSALNTTEKRTLLTQYDVQGHLTAELSAEGAAHIDTLTRAGTLTQEKLDEIWRTHGKHYTYDAAGRRTSSSDGVSAEYYYYDDAGRLRYTINMRDEVEERTYDALGHLQDVIRRGARLPPDVTYPPRRGGLISSPENESLRTGLAWVASDPIGEDSVTHYEYDVRGLVGAVVDPEGNRTEYARNAFGDTTAETRTRLRAANDSSKDVLADGTTRTTSAFDRRGLRVVEVTDDGDATHLNATQKATFDAFGNVTRTRDAKNVVRELRYDLLGRLSTTIDPLGNRWTTTWDAFGRVVYQSGPASGGTTFSYDVAERTVTVRTPEQISVVTKHDRHGQTVKVTDGRGNVTEYGYDADGRQTRTAMTVDGVLVETTAAYDDAGRLFETTDARGTKTRLLYDSNQLWTRTVDPDGLALTTEYSYDAKGQVIFVTDPNGVRTDYRFDRAGRVVERTVAALTLKLKTSFVYDEAGRVITEISPGGKQTKHFFDALGRLSSTVVDPGEGHLNLTHGYEYDKNGNLVAETDPNTNVTRHLYDRANRLVYTVDAAGGVTSYEYDAENRIVCTIGWSHAIDLTGLGHEITESELWARLSGSPGRKGDLYERRVYDGDGRLTWTMDGEGGVTHLTYDGNGNVTERRRYAERLPTDTEATDVALSTAAATIADPSRDLVVRTVYDAANRARYSLTAIGDGTATVVEHRYDGNGNEVKRITYSAPISMSTPLTEEAVADAVSASANDRDVTVSTDYDRANRVQRTTDGEFAVVDHQYDKNGNEVARIERGVQVAPGYVADLELRKVYDDANRVRFTIGQSLAVEHCYDADGREVKRVEYANLFSARPAWREQDVSRMAQQASDVSRDVVTRMVYDAAGRLRFTVDGTGAVVERAFDANGNEVQRIAYATRLAPDTLPMQQDAGALVEWDVIHALVTEGDRDVSVRTIFDAKNRAKFTIDGEGGVVERQYDGVGHEVKRIAYSTRIPVVSRVDEASVTAALAADPSAPRETLWTVYDAANEIRFTVDGTGAVVEHQYDGVGNEVCRRVNARRIPLTTPMVEWEIPYAFPLDFAGLDVVTWTRYDAARHAIYTIDGNGGVVQCRYDGTGKVVERIAYTGKISIEPAKTVGAIKQEIADKRLADDPANERLYTLYDRAGRKSYTVDGAGALVSYRYDARGNLIGRVAYATLLPYAYGRDAEHISGQLDREEVIANAEHNQKISWSYDRANRLVSTTDGSGAVTEYVYDARGNAVKKTVTALGQSRATMFGYDGANRLAYEVNALGEVTEYLRDGNGNVTQRIAHADACAAPGASTDPVVFDPQVRRFAVSRRAQPANRVSSTAYDAAGRVLFAVDAMGALTRNVYDGAGHMVAFIAYADRVTPGTLPPRGVVENQETYANDRVTLTGYDAAGHATHTVDALGYVTETAYDGAGRVTSTTLYAKAVTGLGVGATRDAMARAVTDQGLQAADQANRRTSYTYDGARNVLTKTDALGYVQRFGYDGIGRKTSFTNEKGATWTYAYDCAGRLTLETSPQVALTRLVMDASTNRVVPTAVYEAVQTKLEYDAFGNLVTRIEAYGLPEERKTSYEYDLVGRQVKTTYAAISVYNAAADDLAANGANFTAKRVETDKIAHTSSVTYDAFGDAVSGVDVNGVVTSKIYDAAGRVRYEVDGLGYVTGYERNTFGEAEVVTRYANTIRPSGGNEVANEIIVNAYLRPDPNDRSVKTQYDALGRVVRVVEPETWVVDAVGSAGYAAAAETVTTYDAFGQAFRVARLARGVGSTWAYTSHVFDRRGQETMTIDVERYVTKRAYDAAGNLIAVTEYSNRLGYVIRDRPENNPPPSDDPKDRTVQYTYDLNNRKTTERFGGARVAETDDVGVEYWDWNKYRAALRDGQTHVDPARAALVTGFEYDAVGNLVGTTNALGETTYTHYDALGRTDAVVSPNGGSLDGDPVYPLTVFFRDAFGNVVAQTAYAHGAAALTKDPYAPTSDSNVDRTTLTRYDAAGNAVEVIDALGNRRFTSVDAAGRVRKTWQAVTGTDGVVRTSFVLYEYDNAGQVTCVTTPGSTSVLDDSPGVESTTILTVQPGQADAVRNLMFYNGFGELTSSVIGSAAKGYSSRNTETFEYDRAGRLWRTNQGDGRYRVLLYDLLGNQTSEISSAGTASVKASTWTSAQDVAAHQVANAATCGWRRTDWARDLLGRACVQVLPARVDYFNTIRFEDRVEGDSTDPAHRPQIDQEFDRWGNVVWRTNPHEGNPDTAPKSRFEYDAWNHVIVETLPTVRVRNADGGLTSVAPTTYTYYDKLGRLAATADARGNINRQLYDPAGNLSSEAHADGGWVHRYYDAFGELTTLIDAEGRITRYAYDRLGRNVAITAGEAIDEHTGDTSYVGIFRQVYAIDDAKPGAGDPLPAGYNSVANRTDGTFTTRFEYDELGHRIRVTNGAGEVTQYAFDLRGNVVATIQPLGQVEKAAFDFFGHQIGQVDGNGKFASWQYDAFGHVVYHKDIGGVAHTYAYDEAMQLTAEQNGRGHDVRYGYDGAGQLYRIDDGGVDQRSVYGYNAAGQKVFEQMRQYDFVQSKWVTYQDQSLDWDDAGRLRVVESTVAGGARVETDYDAAGNRIWQQTTYRTESKTSVQTSVGHWYYGDGFSRKGARADENDPLLPDHNGTQNGEWQDVRVVDGVNEWDGSENWHTGIFWWYFDTYTDWDLSATAQQTLWFAYDSMNRQVLVDGAADGRVENIANVTKDQGHILSYDKNGNRTSDTRWGTRVRANGYWWHEEVVAGRTVTVQTPMDAEGAPPTPPIGAQSGYTTTFNGYVYTWYLNANLGDLSSPYSTFAGPASEYYTYDAANRLSTVSASRWKVNGDPASGASWTEEQDHTRLDTRLYDGASRVVQSGPGVAIDQGFVDALTGGADGQANGAAWRVSAYDANGRVVSQNVFKANGEFDYQLDSREERKWTVTEPVQATDGTGRPVTNPNGAPVYYRVQLAGGVVVRDEEGYAKPDLAPDGTVVYLTRTVEHHATVAKYDNAGNMKEYTINQPSVSCTYQFTTSANEADGYRQTSITGWRSDNSGNHGETKQYFDANGFLYHIMDMSVGYGQNDRSFVNDAYGNVLVKTQEDNRVRTLVVDRKVIAEYGYGADPVNPRTPGGDINYQTLDNFDLNYQPIAGGSALDAPGAYVVRAGDTLQGIAQAVYGDASLWYLIADANGLSGSEGLRAGQAVSVPSRVAGTHNTSDTYRPYDPSRMICDTSPHLPTPAAKSKGCGVLQIVLIVVIVIAAIIATIYTAGAATAAFGAAASSVAAGGAAATGAAAATASLGTLASFSATMGLGMSALAGTAGIAGVLGAAVGGAVGSMVSQGLMNAAGLQDGFSWRDVAVGAIGAAATSGVGWGFSALSKAAPAVNALANANPAAGWVAAGARAAVANAATQGVAYLTTASHSWNWHAVVGAAAGGAAGAAARDTANAVATGAETAEQLAQRSAQMGGVGRFLTGSVSAFAGGITTMAARGGRVVAQQVAVDAFGNSLANSAAEAMAGPPRTFGQFQLDGSKLPQPRGGTPDFTLRRSSVLDYDSVGEPEGVGPAVDDAGTAGTANEPVAPAGGGSGGSTDNASAESGKTRYVVRPGDNLSRILGTSDPRVLGAVMDASGLKSSRIRPGDELWIPGDAYNRTFAEPDQSALGQRALDEDQARLAEIRKAKASAAAAAAVPPGAYPDEGPSFDPDGITSGARTGPGLGLMPGLRRLANEMEFGPGIMRRTYDASWAAATNPDNSIGTRTANGIGVLAMAAPTAAEEIASGILNIPSNFVMAAPLAADAGTHAAMAVDPSLTTNERWVAGAAASGEAGQAILGLLPVVGPAVGAVRGGLTDSLVSEDLAALRSEAARNINEARGILREAGLSPRQRNEIIRSFDLESFRVEQVSAARTEYRVFDDFSARLQGRYTSPDLLATQTDRIQDLALMNNSATRLGQVAIPEGSVVFTGRVAPQPVYSPGLTGGARQTFLTGPLTNYSFTEIMMPR